MMTRGSCVALVATSLTLLSALPAHAQIAAPDASSRWRVQLTPFLWAAGMSGEAAVRGNVAPVNASFGDVVENLDFAIAVHGEVSRNAWTILFEGFFVDLGSEVGGPPISANVDVEFLLSEAGIAYRVGQAEQSFEVLGGVRINNIKGGIELGPAPIVDASRTFADPFIGGRLRAQLGDRWPVAVRGDFGGFALGADFAWNLTGGIGFRASPVVTIEAQWRFLDIDYTDGTGTGQFVYDIRHSGLVLGASFTI